MPSERTPAPNVSDPGGIDWAGRVHRFGAVGSTMDEARLLASQGASHGTAVIAAEQGAGRGRSGRVWVSPPGNLHATVILRPGVAAHDAPQLAFVTALAVAEAVDRLAGPPTTLKWPNDVMRQGAKLAGILLECVEGGAVLAGIGMNVRHTPPGMPYPVASLASLGYGGDPAAVLGTVMESLRAEVGVWREHGFGRVLDRWAGRGPAPGTQLVVRLGGHTEAGRFAGLRADGALLLDTSSGRRAVIAGDVQPCAEPPGMAKQAAC